MTYLTSPLSMPKPNAMVAQIQLTAISLITSESSYLLDLSLAPIDVDVFFLVLIHARVVDTSLQFVISVLLIPSQSHIP